MAKCDVRLRITSATVVIAIYDMERRTYHAGTSDAGVIMRYVNCSPAATLDMSIVVPQVQHLLLLVHLVSEAVLSSDEPHNRLGEPA